MKKIFVVFYLLLNLMVLNSQSQQELNSQAYDNYVELDLQLNKIYQQILIEYEEELEFINAIKLAERAWINYRDLHIKSLYPAEDTLFEYGSFYPVCYWSEMSRLTEDRINQLEVWLIGIEEGDLCRGSIKLKEN